MLINDHPLSHLTTLKLGGRARHFVTVGSIAKLEAAASFARAKQLPVFVLGEGSNVLIDDGGLNAVVIKLTNNKVVFDINRGLLTAGGGLKWDKLVRKAVSNNLQGIECLSGIPGTVGAAPVQNIGAYGQELKDCLVSISAYDLKRKKLVKLSRDNCQFAYRDSLFKKPTNTGRYIIWEVCLKLTSEGKPTVKYDSLKQKFSGYQPTLQEVRLTVLRLRRQKLENPQDSPNAGSFFKNPLVSEIKLKELLNKHPTLPHFPQADGTVKLFAGWLIEMAGWKGVYHKTARVSAKNALVLTNPTGKGTSQDLLELALKIEADVVKKFGVRLEKEVRYIKF